MTSLTILLGVTILLVGGELLVRHASRLALSLGITPLVVGLTVVAFGTSAPELMTSVYSQWVGQSSVAIGNVVGSNIFNVLLILGLSALVAPLTVDTKLLRFDVPLVIVVSLAVVGFAYSGTIAQWEAALLLTVLVAYIAWVAIQSRRSTEPDAHDGTLAHELQDTPEIVPDAPAHWSVSALLTLLGIGMVILGGRFFVSGAVDLARTLNIDEGIIGLTIVAFGTSLPELVTSMLASLRGHRDIAVGNVVGSNLFNLTAVLGLAGVIGGGAMEVAPSMLAFDLPVMTAAAVVLLPVMFTGGRIQRWEGGVFVLYYIAYVTYLVLHQIGHAAAPTFGSAILWFVLPLTLVTLAVVGFRDHRPDSA